MTDQVIHDGRTPLEQDVCMEELLAHGIGCPRAIQLQGPAHIDNWIDEQYARLDGDDAAEAAATADDDDQEEEVQEVQEADVEGLRAVVDGLVSIVAELQERVDQTGHDLERLDRAVDALKAKPKPKAKAKKKG